MMMIPRNLFDDLPHTPGLEEFVTLFHARGVKIERIVSCDASSPEGHWYDQEQDEWVILLRGGAVLEFEEGRRVTLKPGDWLTIPLHVKHRVERTEAETVWLAVHVAPAAG